MAATPSYLSKTPVSFRSNFSFYSLKIIKIVFSLKPFVFFHGNTGTLRRNTDLATLGFP